jgi:hypothetical protein
MNAHLLVRGRYRFSGPLAPLQRLGHGSVEGAPMADVPLQSVKVGWREALNGRYLRAPSVLALVAANLIPLYGVLHWGWDLFVLMTAYWMETGIIGFFTAIRMVLVARWAGLLLVPFFCVHFGGFMAGHAVFLWALFAGGWQQTIATPGEFAYLLFFGTGLWLAFAALFLSHGASFYMNVLRPMHSAKDDPRHKPLPASDIMMTPYGRIIVMHVTILVGAFLVELFKTPLAAFVLLIALKIVADVTAHVRTNFAPIKAITN